VRVVASVLVATALAPAALAGAAPASTATVLGVVSSDGHQVLRPLDALSLQPTSSGGVVVPSVYGPILRSPDRSQLAVSTTSGAKLEFIDVDRMQSLGAMTVSGLGAIELISWPEERRLFGVASACCSARTYVLVLDPVARAVVARVILGGTKVATAPAADGVAVLAAPTKGIGKARIVDVSRAGIARRVTLARIRAGSKWRDAGSQPVGTIRQPGFTTDTAGSHAYVVDASGLVADVDLVTLRVAYHASRSFARAEKELTGPIRYARWVGDGRIAVSGTNQRRSTWTPAGLTLLDTHAWSSRLVDPQASWFVRSPDAMLVVAGGRLSAYDLDGRVRYRLPVASAQTAYADVHGRYAYLWDEDTVRVLDAASGAVAATLPKPDLWLVPGDP
jgi:hypothetical protein